jgi:hypothetical protein
LPADTTILATGVQENKDLEDYLKDLQSEFYKIGDCQSPRKAIDAPNKKPKLAGQKMPLTG